jgi:hypothetical protein
MSVPAIVCLTMEAILSMVTMACLAGFLGQTIPEDASPR